MDVVLDFIIILFGLLTQIVQGLDGVTSLEMTSQSKGAKGDWGRNKRNLRDFLARLDSKMASR